VFEFHICHSSFNIANDNIVGIFFFEMAMKRLQKELPILLNDPEIGSYFLRESSDFVNDSPSEIFRICVYLLPRTELYNYGKFKLEIIVPRNYPFQPPQLRLFVRSHFSSEHECDNRSV